MDISTRETCELNKMQTEIERLKEASQYFTCRGFVDVFTKVDEAIAEAEAIVYAKRFWMEVKADSETMRISQLLMR